MPARCCISSCKNNKTSTKDVENVKYHRFPMKDEQQLKKWCDFMGQDYVPCASHRVCSRHFEPSCYYRYLNTIIALKKDAVPSIGQCGSNLNLARNSYAEKQKRYCEKRQGDASKDSMQKENEKIRNDRRSLTEEQLLQRIKWRDYSQKSRLKKTALLDSTSTVPEALDSLFGTVSTSNQVTMSIIDQPAIDCIDIKHEFNFDIETKEDFATRETSIAEFFNRNVVLKNERETYTDIERDILEPLIDIKQEAMDTSEVYGDVRACSTDSAETEVEEDVRSCSTVSAETEVEEDIKAYRTVSAETEVEEDVRACSTVRTETEVEEDIKVCRTVSTETEVEEDVRACSTVSTEKEMEEDRKACSTVSAENEVEEDVTARSTVSAEFVDVHYAVKKEIETDIEHEIVQPETDIKQETEDSSESEQGVMVGSDIFGEFVDVGDKIAPLVSVNHYCGVFDAVSRVEMWKEEYGTSLLRQKTSDPLCEEELAQDRTELCDNQPSDIVKDIVLPCENIENSVPVLKNPQAEESSDGEGFTCDKCNKIYKSRQQVITHLKTHSLVKPYACDVCNLAFASRGYLTKHKQTHSRKWQFSCSMCSKSFRCSALLEAHTAVHNGRKAYACGQCGRSFSGKYCLTKHVRRSHKSKETSSQTVEKVFVCEHCGKCLSTENDLKEHMTTHTRRRTFHCEQCPKSYATKSYLKNHMMIHTGEKLFICETCNRRCISRGGLKKHLLSHSGEKPFDCTLCGRKFSFRHNLKTHLLRHSGVKPHACSVCGMRFLDKHNQIRHEKTHTKNVIFMKEPEHKDSFQADKIEMR